jgi:hypothetical protein
MREIAPGAAEAEPGALFHNGKEACSIRTTLEETGHPQPPTATGTDDSAAAGIANCSIKQNRSKAVDMRFCWTHDWAQQGQFHITWHKGSFNKADNFSKHHPTACHRDLQSAHLRELPSCNSNCFDCLRNDDNDDDDVGSAANDSAPFAHHAEPKATRCACGRGCVGSPARRPRQSRCACLRAIPILGADL